MKNYLKVLSAFFLLYGGYITAQSKGKEYVFIHIDQNITQRGVSSIIQDHLGFIWMGTNGAGLNQNDEFREEVFKPELVVRSSSKVL